MQALRRRKRDAAGQRSAKAASKRRSKFLQAKILEQMTGEKSRVPGKPAHHGGEVDMFQLPPLLSTSKDEDDVG